MDKTQLRKELLQKRNNIDGDYSISASQAIFENALQNQKIQGAKTILSYMPYGKEANILPLNQWILDSGKNLCIPRVKDSTVMEAIKIEDLDKGLVKKAFGILEPQDNLGAIDIHEIDLVLVPGVAFDKYGNRLGHGKGYYDRFLSKCSVNTIFIGICYSFQLLESIPFSSHDVKVHYIITESSLYTMPHNLLIT